MKPTEPKWWQREHRTPAGGLPAREQPRTPGGRRPAAREIPQVYPPATSRPALPHGHGAPRRRAHDRKESAT